MLRHVVAFTWKDGVTTDQVAAVVEGLGRLPGAIPQIAAYRFGPDLGLADGNADFVVVADFASAEDWRAYLAHPAHVRIVEELVAPIRASRLAVQFEMDA